MLLTGAGIGGSLWGAKTRDKQFVPLCRLEMNAVFGGIVCSGFETIPGVS